MLQLLSALGFLLSSYAFIVERRLRIPGYRPLCDLSPRISCSRALGSGYGRLLGVPNAVLGMAFYLLVFLTGSPLLISLGLFASLFLAYLSYAVQKNLCLVCTGIYLINFLLFLVG